MDRTHATPADHGWSEPVRVPTDAELIDRVRAGDLDAFDPLYVRHARPAMLHARHWARGEAAAEDLRAEAFTRVLSAIRSGHGPTETFRPYLMATMRHVASDWAQSDRRIQLVPDLVDLAGPADDEDPVIAALERSLAGQAFMSLPERWQLVLWHTEVEQEGPTRVAPLLGIEPGAVAALAYRAREGLKQAYLQAHITDVGAESCRPFAEKLGTHTRGRLGRRDAAKVSGHMHDCAECAGLFAMLKYLNSHIGGAVAPAVLGTAVAAKVVAVLGGSGAAAAHSALALRVLAKARHASPRQQAVAATTTAAVAAAAVAFALAGSPRPPAAAAKPTPRPVVTRAVAISAPPARTPPKPTPEPKPTEPAPKPKPSVAAQPAPVMTPVPTPTPPVFIPPPVPTPTPTPTRARCPGAATDWLSPNAPNWLQDIVADPRDEVADPSCGPGGPPTRLP